MEVSGAVRPIYGSLGVKRLRGKIQVNFPTTLLRAFITPWVLYTPPIFHSKFTCEKFGQVDESCVHGDVNRMMGWVGRVAHVGECEVITHF